MISSKKSVLTCQATRRSVTLDFNVQQQCCKTPHQHAFCRTTAPRRHTSTHTNTRQHTSTHINTHQHTSTHTNTHQHTSTHINTHQHTSTHNMPFFSIFLPSSRLAFHSLIRDCTRLRAELMSAGSYAGQDNSIINIRIKFKFLYLSLMWITNCCTEGRQVQGGGSNCCTEDRQI